MGQEEAKTYYSAKELAGLPGVPRTRKGVIQKAQREDWAFGPHQGQGGGREYAITSLPPETRDYLLDRMIAELPQKACDLPAVVDATFKAPAKAVEKKLPAIDRMKGWQRQTMDARLAILRATEEIAQVVGVEGAILRMVKDAAAGTLPDYLQALLPVAIKCSSGGEKKLSRTTLYRWRNLWKSKGIAALAPEPREKDEAPAWTPYFLDAYRKFSRPSIPSAMKDMQKTLPAHIPMPHYDTIDRWLKKFSKLEIQKGRATGSELKALKGFVRRDLSEFLPGDIAVADGHTLKAKVAHPVHGRPFAPEVCMVIDAVTRVVLGWSCGLAESWMTVADAIRHAVTVDETKGWGCIPAILYTDGGSGNKATVNSDPYVGLYARLGVTFRTGKPGNPEGRGIIERLNATLWIPAAKKLATYTGKDADRGTVRRVYLQLEKDVRAAAKTGKEGKKSDLLLSWSDFIAFLEDEVLDYNRRPHSALPKVRDPQSGRIRHMAPGELWAEFIANGWKPEVPTAAELAGLFRPQIIVKTYRGEVRVGGNIYYHADLIHYGGEQVVVQYDIHDPDRVWVWDNEERLICIAGWNANKKSFFPVSAVEQARGERCTRRLANATRRIDEIEAEAAVPVQVAPEHIELPAETIEYQQRVIELQAKKAAAPFIPGNDYEAYAKLTEEIAAGEPLTDDERAWVEDYENFTRTGRKRGLHKADWQPFAVRNQRLAAENN